MPMFATPAPANDARALSGRRSRASVARVAGLVAIVTLLVGGSGAFVVAVGFGPHSASPPVAAGAPVAPSVGAGAGALAEARASMAGYSHPHVANQTISWSLLNASTHAQPPARSAAGLAYDSALGAVVLFGGYNSSGFAYNDTWEFTNGSWRQLNLSVAPTPRWEPGFGYDPAINALVLFGGRDLSTFYNDTWTFNGTWTYRGPAPTYFATPSVRGLVGLSYDPALGGMLLFGGGEGNVPAGSFSNWLAFNDTWLYASGAWSNLTVADNLTLHPPGEYGVGMAYDAATQQMVLLGGENSTGNGAGVCNPVDLEWTFANGTWTNRTASASPFPDGSNGLYDMGMVWDSALNGIVVFGGIVNAPGCPSTNQTWLLGPSGWTNLTPVLTGPSPPANSWLEIAYDQSTAQVVMEGGNTAGSYTYWNATWLLSETGAGGTPLSAWISAAPATSGPPPLEVNLTGGAIGGVLPYSYSWNFANGVNASGAGPTGGWTENYTSVGVYVATLTVQDANGTQSTSSITINVSYPSTGFVVAVHASPTHGPAPLNVSFSATTNPGYGPLTYAWGFGDGQQSSASAPSHVYPQNGTYAASVTVTDAANATAVGTVTILVGNATQIGSWSSLTVAATPAARSAEGIAYDPSLGVVVMFGGYGGPTPRALGDTWEYSNGSWTNVSGGLNAAPAARWEGGFTYDPKIGGLVLFGGRDLGQFYNDTWLFNSSGWHRLSTPVAPTPRGLIDYIYDPALGEIVLFGGAIGNLPAGNTGSWAFDSDTWEFNGTAWTNATASLTGRPPAIASGALFYDPNSSSVVLYGGDLSPNGCSIVSAQWVLSNGSWTNESGRAAYGPGGVGGLESFASVFDPGFGGTIVFGGETETPAGVCYSTNQTWLFESGTWLNLSAVLGATLPTASQGGGLAYDLADGYAVLFGGGAPVFQYLDTTWVLANVSSPPAPLPILAHETVALGPGPIWVTFSVTVGGFVAVSTIVWTFGDGAIVIGPTAISHRYVLPGSYLPSVDVLLVNGRSSVVHFPAVSVTPGGPTGPGGSSSVSPGISLPLMLLALAVLAGVLAGGGLWAALDWRRQRLRKEGDELIDAMRPGAPPEP